MSCFFGIDSAENKIIITNCNMEKSLWLLKMQMLKSSLSRRNLCTAAAAGPSQTILQVGEIPMVGGSKGFLEERAWEGASKDKSVLAWRI